MRAKKTYRSIHSLSLTICVTVDGQQMYLDFGGGFNHPRRQNGSYSTSNPKIQAALEKHPRFGSAYEITKVTSLEPQVQQASVVVPDGSTISVPEGSVILEPEKEDVPDAEPFEQDQYISRVKNGQEAKMELNRTFKIPWSRLKNLAQVKSEAAKLNIVYANWK